MSIEIRRARQLAAAPAAVWAVLARFDELGQWAPNVAHSAYTTAQTAGVGTARRVQVGSRALIETVIAWAPERELAYTLVGLPPIVRAAHNAWQLAPAGGGTHVTLVSTIERRAGLTGIVAARVLGQVLGHASTGLLAGLAAHLGERRA